MPDRIDLDALSPHEHAQIHRWATDRNISREQAVLDLVRRGLAGGGPVHNIAGSSARDVVQGHTFTGGIHL